MLELGGEVDDAFACQIQSVCALLPLVSGFIAKITASYGTLSQFEQFNRAPRTLEANKSLDTPEITGKEKCTAMCLKLNLRLRSSRAQRLPVGGRFPRQS